MRAWKSQTRYQGGTVPSDSGRMSLPRGQGRGCVEGVRWREACGNPVTVGNGERMRLALESLLLVVICYKEADFRVSSFGKIPRLCLTEALQANTTPADARDPLKALSCSGSLDHVLR